jgi:L-rhamnose isomerase/sugar isomerase
VTDPTIAACTAEQNRTQLPALEDDYAHLSRHLERRGIRAEHLVERALQFRVAIPSWALARGGTRFARFPLVGEPRTIAERLEDCAQICSLVRVTNSVSLHFPWDETERPSDLQAALDASGLRVDSTNSNTFQDQPGQRHSYQFGSLTHTDPAVRRQAIEHNLQCLAHADRLRARAHTVWIGDGGNFPGQVHARRAFERYLGSLHEIYARLPEGCRLLLEHKLFEPAFYSTVVNDWGTSYVAARELGDRAWCLVDLGHHAPNVNVEQIVARLIHLEKLGGFHFNDSCCGDDDLDAGSIKPFQLFLIFNELVDADLEGVPGFEPAFMIDQSHNVTDPIESLITSGIELVRAFVQAHLVDRGALAHYQATNDAVMALQSLKQAFTTDVSPILALARYRAGGAIDPVAAYRASGYRQRKASERPLTSRREAGIV